MGGWNKGKSARADWLRGRVNYDGPECLTWPFSKVRGYGNLKFGDKITYAHRVMCELVHGPDPTGEHEAAHSCGRGHFGCVDPRHLSWKTKSENALDCRAHGTQARNMAGNRGKLSDEDAAEIRTLKGYLTQAEIAAMFGVSEPTIRDIFSGRSRIRSKVRKPFSPAEVLAIRRDKRLYREIALDFKTDTAAVSRIKNRVSYADV